MKKAMSDGTARLGTLDQEALEEGVSQAGITIILGLAFLIGTWGLTCLVSGFSRMGGIMELARGWLTAVTGG
ncbi:MAG: hypothetical protein ACOY3Z_02750 [Thermodesulfobacteriota bacterium]